jgi:hypothetical protein
MSVSPTVTIVARPAPKRTPAARPKVDPHAARRLVAVESDIIEASCELVYQRDDLIEASSPVNNRALRVALAALDRGDLAMVREQLLIAIRVEDEEEAAARRAEERRLGAHGFTRSATRRVETLLTAREGDSDDACDVLLPWPLDGEPAADERKDRT